MAQRRDRDAERRGSRSVATSGSSQTSSADLERVARRCGARGPGRCRRGRAPRPRAAGATRRGSRPGSSATAAASGNVKRRDRAPVVGAGLQDLRRVRLGEEARDDRLRPGVARRGDDRARDVVGVRDERRDEDHEHRVDVRVGEHGAHRALVGRGGRRRDEVDRVRGRRVGRDEAGAARPGSRPRAPAPRAPRPRTRRRRGCRDRRRSTRSRPGGPGGSGWCTSTCAVSSSSASVSTRITPAWRNSASIATSDDASAAVCDAAARVPAWLRPLFTARIGLL